MNLKSLIDSIIDWMITAGTVRSDRPYCDLGFDKEFTREEIAKYFTTEEQEKQFILNYREMNPVAKKGYLYIQGEINVIYSFHKGFVSRYKSRLQCYRDDSAQKCIHTRRAIQTGYQIMQDKIDKAEGK